MTKVARVSPLRPLPPARRRLGDGHRVLAQLCAERARVEAERPRTVAEARASARAALVARLGGVMPASAAAADEGNEVAS